MCIKCNLKCMFNRKFSILNHISPKTLACCNSKIRVLTHIHYDMTVYVPFNKPCTKLIELKYKLILLLKTIALCCYMCSLVEILCKLEWKIGLVCWQLLHNLHATKILWFNLAMNFLYFPPDWWNCKYFWQK